MKKLFALVLALIMVMSLATTAFAEEPTTGTITINNAIVGQKYTVYKMATLESYSGTNYSYLVNDYWKPFFTEHDVPVDTTNHLAYAGTITNSSKFAAAAIAYAEVSTAADTPSVSITATSETVVFEGLDFGYYCIDSTLGAACGITNADPDGVITEKNTPPVIDKKVQEDSTGAYGKTNDDDLGATINFRIVVTKYAGAVNYVVGDKLSAGLTLDENLATNIKISFAGTPAAAGDYELIISPTEEQLETYVGAENVDAFSGYSFLVDLSDEAVQKMVDGGEIVIDYSATLNENAIIGGAGNPNEANMVYGNEPKSRLEPVKTTTYSWPFQVFKYTNENNVKVPLNDAKFSVYETNPETNTSAQPMKLKFVETKDGIDIYQHVHGAETGTDVVTEITTNATGKFRIEGLDSATYYLKETEAPAGYHMLRSVVEIKIGVNGAYTDSSLSHTVANTTEGYIEVLNSTGTVLPETGGIGTTLFYVFGGILVAAAVVLLVTKKRMVAEN